MKTKEKLNTSKKDAEIILNYLVRKNMSFCWLENGRFIRREDCIKIINED